MKKNIKIVGIERISDLKKVLNKTDIDNTIYCIDSSCPKVKESLEKLGLKEIFSTFEIDNESSRYQMYDYCIKNNIISELGSMMAKAENLLHQYFENLLPEFDKTKLTFKILNCHENLDLTIPYSITNGWNMVAGFHYWHGPRGILAPKALDFIAFIDKTPVAVIEFGEYGFSEDDLHFSLSFLDVHKNYRKNGLSKIILSEFKKMINEKYSHYDNIRISDFSELGNKFDLKKIIQNEFEDSKIKPAFYER